jgi:hypothetical protein
MLVRRFLALRSFRVDGSMTGSTGRQSPLAAERRQRIRLGRIKSQLLQTTVRLDTQSVRSE